ARRFLDYLRGTGGRAFGAEGYRAADLSAAQAPALRADRGFRGQLAPERPTPAPAVMNKLIAAWTSLERPVNILVVLDTSGSMNEPVPGTKLTRMQLLQQTAAYGFGRLTNTTSIGMWQFSNILKPTTD